MGLLEFENAKLNLIKETKACKAMKANSKIALMEHCRVRQIKAEEIKLSNPAEILETRRNIAQMS